MKGFVLDFGQAGASPLLLLLFFYKLKLQVVIIYGHWHILLIKIIFVIGNDICDLILGLVHLNLIEFESNVWVSIETITYSIKSHELAKSKEDSGVRFCFKI